MTLNDCVEMGRECGLETYSEAIDNVMLHAPMLFAYSDMSREVDQLLTEFRMSGIDGDDYLPSP